MSQSFTFTFEANWTREKAEKVIKNMREYLAKENASDMLLTAQGDPKDDEEEEAPARRR